MAKAASKCFFFLFLFNILTIPSSSATLVGFAYDARGNTPAASLGLKLNNVSSTHLRVYVADQRVLNLTSLSNSNTSSVDLYLSLSLVVDLMMQSELSALSWLQTNVLPFHPRVNIKSIILSCSSEEFAGKSVLPLVLSALKSFHSVIRIHLGMKVEATVAFPVPLLENLSTSHGKEISLIFGFIKKTGSFVIIEAGIDVELIKKAIKATSVLPDSNILIDLVIKSPLVPNAKQIAEFTEAVQIDELCADLDTTVDFLQKDLISLSRRELVNNLKTSIHDTTIFSTTPIPTDGNPTPTIVTVPATIPATANPDSTPLPIPSATPVNNPQATPVNPAAPITNPATTPAPVTVPGGAQPVTNPAATYPPPAGNVPVTPPATTNAPPAVAGQSWCVAKTGVSEKALQQALDYACGIGGADCSLIQPGGNCYNPNSLQNHASYAFNSYYQKNRSPTSCDFGGTATLVNTNPSSGSCVFPSSSPQPASTPPPAQPATTTPPAQPASTTPPAQPASTTPPAQPAITTPPAQPATTTPPAQPASPGFVSPPGMLNSSNPPSVFGSGYPPVVNTSTSTSAASQLILSFLTSVTSFFTGIIILQI